MDLISLKVKKKSIFRSIWLVYLTCVDSVFNIYFIILIKNQWWIFIRKKHFAKIKKSVYIYLFQLNNLCGSVWWKKNMILIYTAVSINYVNNSKKCLVT